MLSVPSVCALCALSVLCAPCMLSELSVPKVYGIMTDVPLTESRASEKRSPRLIRISCLR